ncbi:response regulator [Polaribacter batillariae]|uniref:histidine kinase n=1 Tax=Polaribacter batillariae TaxID=2808900 RepID=A0ABX7SWF6_9FLAO|nr:hybrid sensor histidine kinase/response regulator transcription factor [Polaribacter batillariae]QTD37635.1 response regulator [Polaribacter batillariae]
MRFKVLISLFFIAFSTIFSQNKKILFEEFVIEDGLASINTILKDKNGFMWFGGTHGLYRFDGYKFKIFTTNNSNSLSLSNNNVTSLFEDAEGYLWVGTMHGGINKYNPITETFTNCNNSKKNIYKRNYITTISGDFKKTIWFGTFGDGLYRFNKQNNSVKRFFKTEKNKNTISNNNVFSIIVDNSRVWITTNAGTLDCYNLNSKTFNYYKYRNKEYKSTRTGQRMCLDSYQNLWVGTESDGLYKFDTKTKTFKHYQKEVKSISSNEITDIKEGKPGEIWMTTYGGLNFFNTNTNKVISYKSDIYDEHSITNNVSYSLFIDKNTNIWMGMGDGTVNKTINSPFEIYQTSYSKKIKSLSFNVVTSLYLNKNNLWIGTGGGGLDRLNLTNNTFYNYKNTPSNNKSIPSNIVMTVIVDDENTVWTGNFKNSIIGFKDKKSNDFFEAPISSNLNNDFTNPLVFDLIEDNFNNIWIATYNNGLYKYNKSTHLLTSFPELKTNKLICLHIDKSKNIWVGTDRGLKLYDTTNQSFFTLKDLGFQQKTTTKYPIKDIFEDKSGNIWLATEGDGIFFINLNKKEIKNIRKENGLPSNSMYGIIQDKNNNYWFGSNKGIISYNLVKNKIFTYNTSDGLPTNDFESGAIAISQNGKLFFGSKKGLIAFYPEQLINKPTPINLLITNLRIFNNDINPLEQIENYKALDSSITYKKNLQLPYSLDNFGFEFAVPGYSSPHNIEYQYKLDGIDNRWMTTSSERHYANYSNIPSGSYTFKVRAFNENQQDTNNNIAEKELKITIHPVWWQSNGAYFIYFLLIAGLTLYIYRGIRDRVRLKNELLIEKYKHEKDEELHQSKINFFTTISHELRTSLTLILSPIQQLSTIKTNNKASNLIMTMNRNGQRLLSLINQILDFRKLESTTAKLNVSKINLPEFFNELCIPFYQYANESNIQFQLTISNSCNTGWVDADKLEIIIYNVLSNAFKYTNNKIDVNIDLDDKDEKLIIKIKDNGKGIREEEIKKIFQNFYQINTTTQTSKGSGIGLAITKNLVDIHLGEIEVKSEPNVYTVFNITIPIVNNFYDEIDFSEQPSRIEIDNLVELETPFLPNLDTSVETISVYKPLLLIVEDNFELMNLLKNHFSSSYKIVSATNGLEACEKALNDIPDVIISDIMMPKMNGLEFCKKLKTDIRTSHIPIILLTARGSHTFQMEGFQYGADDYITKPFNIELLNQRVKNLLETRKILREKFRKDALFEPKDIAINNTDEMFIEKIMKIIEKNMSDSKFTVKQLSAEIGMSHSVLYRKIIALSGQNINEFIKSIKLTRAAQLISDSHLSINEISDMTGFSNPKYFSTCFKKKYNTTPTKYREKNMKRSMM